MSDVYVSGEKNQYAKAGTHHPSLSISIRQCLITQEKNPPWPKRISPPGRVGAGGGRSNIENERQGNCVEITQRKARHQIFDFFSKPLANCCKSREWVRGGCRGSYTVKQVSGSSVRYERSSTSTIRVRVSAMMLGVEMIVTMTPRESSGSGVSCKRWVLKN